MNNFDKVYTTLELKKKSIITLVTLPMEESVMVPVAQIIDLMKRGENILFFSFKHDSIKINEFLVPALKGEFNPASITGGLSVFDIHQIPSGKNLLEFIEEQVIEIKTILEKENKELSFIFIDFPVEKLEDEKMFENLKRLKLTQDVTSILASTLKMPIISASQMQDQEGSKKIMDDFMETNTIKLMKSESPVLMANSDYIIGISREKNNFWKKLINFLLFWRKRSNFVLKVLKNRNGSDSKEYRMNINMEEFKTEVL